MGRQMKLLSNRYNWYWRGLSVKALDLGSSMNRYWATGNRPLKLKTKIKTPKIINKILVLIIFIITNLGQPYAYAVSTYSQDRWKLYLHTKVISDKQYVCISRLWYLESRWNNRADNRKSTAYGIAQVLDTKTNDPFKQIDAGLRYIKHRYKGDGCKALAHHNKHGYY
jgi:hypothetical protein